MAAARPPGHLSDHLSEALAKWGIVAPVDPEAVSRWRAAPRLPSLYGKVGGFLGNRKDNAAPLLLEVKELLARSYELQDALVVDKFIYSRPTATEIIDQLSDRCDFVVTAIAD